MFKTKTHPNFLKLLLLAFLAIFIAGKTAFVVHSASHNYAEVSGKNSPNEENSQNCEICSFLIYQNHITLVADLFIASTTFYLLILARKFNRVKLAFFLSSNCSRAPPVIS